MPAASRTRARRTQEAAAASSGSAELRQRPQSVRIWWERQFGPGALGCGPQSVPTHAPAVQVGHDDGHEVERKTTAPALDEVTGWVLDEGGYERRTKQHDSALSAGQEDTTPALIAQLTADRVAREASAREAREAVDAQRAKRDSIAREHAAAFEEPRARDQAQARLTAATAELRRRERVAEASASAAAAAIALEVKHRGATEAFQEIEARKRELRDAEDAASLKRADESRKLAERVALQRAKDALASGAQALDKEEGPPGSPGSGGGAGMRRSKSKTSMGDVVKLRWQAHDAQFGVFTSHTPALVCASDVPFLDLKLLEMAHAHVPEEVDVKALQARWHPDKFLQKFGTKLLEEEREAILSRVNDISVAINALKTS